MRIRLSALTLSGALALTACDDHPTGTSEPSRFSATIAGSVSAIYEGTGHFGTTTLRRPAAPPLFWLRSRGTGAASNQGFELYRRGVELPSVGTYALGHLAGDDDGAPEGFGATYLRRTGNAVERFSARSGELQIMAASGARIEGWFRFHGVHTHTCTRTGALTSCVAVVSSNPDQVEVEGTFQAVPSRVP